MGKYRDLPEQRQIQRIPTLIDLVGINYGSAHFSEAYNTSSGVLTVSDGSTTTSLTFDNFNATFDFASDRQRRHASFTIPPVAKSKVDTSNRVVADGVGIKFRLWQLIRAHLGVCTTSLRQ